MRILSSFLIITFCLSLGIPAAARAENIKIGVSHQAPEKQAIQRPSNGMLTTQVTERFGSPMAIDGPVGDPAITTWRYEDFTVYFEFDKVIHTVLNFEPAS